MIGCEEHREANVIALKGGVEISVHMSVDKEGVMNSVGAL